MFTRMKNRLAELAYNSNSNEVEQLNRKSIEEFIADCSRSMSADLARSIIDTLGGWEMFKEISRTVNANANPLGVVHHYMSDEQTVALMRDNRDDMYPFVLDRLYVNTSYPAYTEVNPNVAPIPLRLVMNAFKHGVKDDDSQGVLLASIILYASTQDLYQKFKRQSGTGVDMIQLEIFSGKTQARHVINALGGYDRFKELGSKISKSKRGQELKLIDQYLSEDKIIEEFNFGKYHFEDSARSLLTIDVTCAGRYKPIVDPSTRITLHALLNVVGDSGSNLARPSDGIKTAASKLMIHMATEVLCRELAVYEIVN